MLLGFLYNEVILLTLNLSNVWTVNKARKEQYHDPNVTECSWAQNIFVFSLIRETTVKACKAKAILTLFNIQK